MIAFWRHALILLWWCWCLAEWFGVHPGAERIAVSLIGRLILGFIVAPELGRVLMEETGRRRFVRFAYLSGLTVVLLPKIESFEGDLCLAQLPLLLLPAGGMIASPFCLIPSWMYRHDPRPRQAETEALDPLSGVHHPD